jgi:hypothetical protein
MLKHHIAALLLLIASAAQAQQPFEAVIAGAGDGCNFSGPPFVHLEWITPDRVITHPDVIAVASAPGQPVFALTGGFIGTIIKIEPDDTRTSFFGGAPGLGSRDIAVSRTGRVFTAVDAGLAVFSPAGVQEATYPMPGRSLPRTQWTDARGEDSRRHRAVRHVRGGGSRDFQSANGGLRCDHSPHSHSNDAGQPDPLDCDG